MAPGDSSVRGAAGGRRGKAGTETAARSRVRRARRPLGPLPSPTAVRWVHSRPRNGPWESRCPGGSGATNTAERRVPRPPPPRAPRPTHAWACPLWGRGPASLRPHHGLITPPGAVPEPRVQPPTRWSPPMDTPRASDSRHSPAPLSPNCPSVPCPPPCVLGTRPWVGGWLPQPPRSPSGFQQNHPQTPRGRPGSLLKPLPWGSPQRPGGAGPSPLPQRTSPCRHPQTRCPRLAVYVSSASSEGRLTWAGAQ